MWSPLSIEIILQGGCRPWRSPIFPGAERCFCLYLLGLSVSGTTVTNELVKSHSSKAVPSFLALLGKLERTSVGY